MGEKIVDDKQTKEKKKTEALKVRDAIIEIIGNLKAIEKSNKSLQGYYFRGIEDIVNEINSLFFKYRIFPVPSYEIVKDTVREIYTKKGKRTVNDVVLKGTFNIYDSYGESVTYGPFIGKAYDFSDKAMNQAMSFAYKYFYIQAFIIHTQEHAEGDYNNIELNTSSSQESKKPLQTEPPIRKKMNKDNNILDNKKTRKTYPNIEWTVIDKISNATNAKEAQAYCIEFKIKNKKDLIEHLRKIGWTEKDLENGYK